MRHLPTSLLLLCAFTATAQRGPTIDQSQTANAAFDRGCLTDVMRQRARPVDPASVNGEMRMDANILQELRRRSSSGGARAELTIPVMVHIIHQNGSENISDTQVVQGIQDLNDAFNNEGPYATPDGVVTGIHFCLAQQDFSGQFTSGIDRVESPLTNVTPETQDMALKQLPGWMPFTYQYLNIYLVREITSESMGAGVAGYATMPASHGGYTDGIVNEARWFGSTPDNSKVHIHEVGHYLGLYHTFEGGCTNTNCLLDGDRVCDTPPDASTAPVGCGATVNSCSTDADDASANNPFRAIALGGRGDVPDLFEDYMDYGLQACQHLFTQRQADRMNAALTGVRGSLLTSTGCQSSCEGGFLRASFSVRPDIMVGGQTTFTNTSIAVPAHSFAWYVDDVPASTGQNLEWTFTTAGPHTIRLRLYNTNTGCFVERESRIVVPCNAQASFSISPPGPQPGEAVTFTSASTGILAYQWWVDGLLAGQNSTLTSTFATGGAHHVQLIVAGSACRDTSAQTFIPVGDCTTGENNTWVVGGHDIVSFNSGGPVSQDTGSNVLMNGIEGLASISDRFGKLLLYTDGQAVYNARHEIISGGLGGGGSSSQAALILPKPGSSSIFYIFTTDDWGLGNGGNLSYTEVDMGLNNGAGGVVQLAVPLMHPSSEKLTAVRSCNGEDVWVIGLAREEDAFYSFNVTAAGVNTTPVISHGGFTQGPELGCMKASPKGNKLAGAFRGGPGTVELMDLDNSTGRVSNSISLGWLPEYAQYGVEFSPDGSKLYVSNGDDAWGVSNHIYQFDLTSGIPEIIRNSRTRIGTSSCTWSLGSLQLAPNGRIYAILGQAYALGEIRDPMQRA
ncbi:MAG: M43 family zinc metalloprotease [Flavobacteriales bacterium]